MYLWGMIGLSCDSVILLFKALIFYILLASLFSFTSSPSKKASFLLNCLLQLVTSGHVHLQAPSFWIPSAGTPTLGHTLTPVLLLSKGEPSFRGNLFFAPASTSSLCCFLHSLPDSALHWDPPETLIVLHTIFLLTSSSKFAVFFVSSLDCR